MGVDADVALRVELDAEARHQLGLLLRRAHEQHLARERAAVGELDRRELAVPGDEAPQRPLVEADAGASQLVAGGVVDGVGAAGEHDDVRATSR